MATKALTGKRDGDRRSAPPAPQVATGWRNRVVGYGEIDPAACLANPANWRVHPKAQQDALAGVLDQIGWVQTVMVNRTTGHVVDGHLRVALALRREEPTIPVVYVELTAAEERLVLATLDPIGALAVTDGAQLAALLEGLKTGTAAVDDLLSDLMAQADAAIPHAQAEEDDVPPAPAEPITRMGDLIALGEHRLLCGDARESSSYIVLLGDQRVDCMWTDPPYGVSYVGKTADALTIANDGAAGVEAVLNGAFAAVTAVLGSNAPIYIACPPGRLGTAFRVAFCRSRSLRTVSGTPRFLLALCLTRSPARALRSSLASDSAVAPGVLRSILDTATSSSPAGRPRQAAVPSVREASGRLGEVTEGRRSASCWHGTQGRRRSPARTETETRPATEAA